MRSMLLAAVAVFALLPGAPVLAAESGPADVVVAFNKAISERHVDDAMQLLADGAVQYTLRSSHPSLGNASTKVTSDLAAHWRLVTSVVLAATKAYERVPKIIETRVDGDLATIWADIGSTTVEAGGEERHARFSEVYLLVHTAAGWRIGAMADNRVGSNVTAAEAKPAR